MPPHTLCPKCGRDLPPDGEIEFAGMTIPVYSCPECVTRTTFLGEKMELPLTFIFDKNGNAVDPADPDGKIDLTEYG